MVDSKENYKFDLGVEGLINTFGWDFVNKVWLFRYGCVFERYIVILLSERGLHSQSSLRFDFFFRTYATDFAEKNSKGLLVAYFRQCKHVPLKDFLQLPCTITGREIVACSDRRAMPMIQKMTTRHFFNSAFSFCSSECEAKMRTRVL